MARTLCEHVQAGRRLCTALMCRSGHAPVVRQGDGVTEEVSGPEPREAAHKECAEGPEASAPLGGPRAIVEVEDKARGHVEDRDGRGAEEEAREELWDDKMAHGSVSVNVKERYDESGEPAQPFERERIVPWPLLLKRDVEKGGRFCCLAWRCGRHHAREVVGKDGPSPRTGKSPLLCKVIARETLLKRRGNRPSQQRLVA